MAIMIISGRFYLRLFLFVLLTFTGLCIAVRVPNTFITKISEITKNAPPCSEMRWTKGIDLIINFEKDNQLGAVWYSYSDSMRGCWAYHYVRFDTTGNILVDLRNFAIKKDYLERFNYLADPYNPYPNIEYLTDGKGNSIIAYSYVDDQKGGWRIAWTKVDSMSKIDSDYFEETSSSQSIPLCSSSKFDFHFLGGSGCYHPHRNPERVNSLCYTFHYKKKKPHLIPPDHYIETNDNNLLCIAQSFDSAEIHYQLISPKGKFISGGRVKIDDVTKVIWGNVELPGFAETFQWSDAIWYITTVHSFGYHGPSRLFLIVFDKTGKVVKQKASIKGQILSIDSMPTDAKRFVKMSKGIIYYFGFDNEGNLYYWNSRLGYRKNIFAPFYSVHYSHIKDELYNPPTEDNLFPDSMTWLDRWSSGGKLKYDMKLLIGCNKSDRTYAVGEPIGIRCGIGHVRLNEEMYLAKAYYSPNKHDWPPEITVYIDAPGGAEKEKEHLGYMGDDVIFTNRPKVDSIRVPPGKIFNPSPDNLFYNIWAGIYRFETPGIYRIWCSYTFDSLTSSIKVNHIDTLYSDILEIIIK